MNLFYLVPELRGQGLGRLLHDHAVAVFAARGHARDPPFSVAHAQRARDRASTAGWAGRASGRARTSETMEILELAL